MVSGEWQVFTTDQVTQLVGLNPKTDKWRIIKFAQAEEYGINPSVSAAGGSGTRRLYDLGDVCEIALALRLLETGLRSKVIGKIIKQLRGSGGLAARIGKGDWELEELFLTIVREPKTGRPLKDTRRQKVDWAEGMKELEEVREMHPQWDLIVVPVSSLLSALKERLDESDEEG